MYWLITYKCISWLVGLDGSGSNTPSGTAESDVFRIYFRRFGPPVENNPTKIHKIGVDDRFGESGDSEELLDLVGLTIESIETAAKSLL